MIKRKIEQEVLLIDQAIHRAIIMLIVFRKYELRTVIRMVLKFDSIIKTVIFI
jgi:hypothetical protein